MWESIRYYLALFIVVSWPPMLLFWFMIHPLIDFWRKVGPGFTYAIIVSVMTILGAGLFRIRHVLLAVEYGTHNPLIIDALILNVVIWVVFFPVRKQLTFRILIGLPELNLKTEQKLLTEGMFAKTRNPRYVGAMLFGFSVALLANYLAVYVVVLAFAFGLYGITLLEEKELRARFGKAYDEYCRRVPRFIPKF
jgi:protein-S-isoprenylcysteine O-methyltransferase Ste14